jgi:hypothetical protein
MSLSTSPNIDYFDKTFLSFDNVIQFVAKRGFSAGILHLKNSRPIDLHSFEQSDILFIYHNEYLKERKGLIKLLLVNSRPNQLIIGVLDQFEKSAFFDFIEIGIQDFIFKPITTDSLVDQLDPLIHLIMDKNENHLKKLPINLGKKHTVISSYLSVDEVIKKTFVYSSNVGVLSSDLTFVRKLNGHLLFILGKGKDNNISSVLETAELYDWLEIQVDLELPFSDIIEALDKNAEMTFEIAMINCDTKELKYIGYSDLIVIRKGKLLQIESGFSLKLESGDTCFLFSKGCYLQVGACKTMLGKDDFLKVLKMIEPHNTKERRRRLNSFYENFLKTDGQNDDISLLSFRI